MILTREEVLQIVNSWTENKNLVKHMLAVEAAMKGLSNHFSEDESLWGTVGLVHDADYDKYPDKHPALIIEKLKELNQPEELINAVEAHAMGFNGFNREPQNNLEWSIYCCDELTGLIIAVALVRPEKKLSAVTVENVLSKWDKKDFAKGVSRSQIALCEEKLGIKLTDFIEIVLKSMQQISDELGL